MPPDTALRTDTTRRRWWTSVRVLVGALVALPLTGATLFAYAEIERTTAAHRQARTVASDGTLLVELMTLRTNVLEERLWRTAVARAEESGIEPFIVGNDTSVDIAAELADAAKGLDQTLERLEDPALAAAVDDARSGDGTYLAVEARLTAMSTRVLGDLLDAAGVLPGSDDLDDALRVLEAAADGSRAVALNLTALVEFGFPELAGTDDGFVAIATLQNGYRDAVSAMKRHAPVNSDAWTALDDLERSLPNVRFNNAITTLVRDVRAQGTDGLAPITADTGARDRTVRALQGGAESISAHLGLIDAGGRDVQAAAAAISDGARSDARRSMITIALLFVGSLVFVALTAATIITPLNRLADRARRMNSGEPPDDTRISGPREIREAAIAIEDAAVNLDLIERQASALARGELDHPSLSQPAYGSLGTAVQRAVQTLATSLAEREQSRREAEEANRELHETQAQLLQAQKLEAIGQLAAGVAHEINTPVQYVADNTSFVGESFDVLLTALDHLTAVARLADEAAVEAHLDELDFEFLRDEIPAAIDASREGLARVSEIVRAMKDFAHPGSEMGNTDLNRAITSTATVSRNEWRYVAELHLDLDESLPPVCCHEGQLKQVVLNLIVNAAHAIGDDTGEGANLITVSTSHDDGHVVIAVGDTGCGMTDEVAARVFDPFFTTKEVGRGTGQGLAMVHRIVAAHRGTIRVESAVGVGTTFVLRIPIDAPTGDVGVGDVPDPSTAEAVVQARGDLVDAS